MEFFEERLEEFTKRPDDCLIISSKMCESLKKTPCMLGIDEAGRGPVLGPMVYACSFTPIDNIKALKEIGLADSKVLTDKQREAMFQKMNASQDQIPYIIDIISPNYISNKMLARFKTNLNEISHQSAKNLIKMALDKGADIQEVYVDTVGSADKYQAFLQDSFPGLQITVESKADATFPIVSGASICAKVTRDRVVENWKFLENAGLEDLTRGSGYPADPSTKQFMVNAMDKIFGFPQLVRTSWSTAYKIIEKDCVPVVWEDDEDEEPSNTKRKLKQEKGNKKLSTFFVQAPGGDSAGKKRHQYFRDRKLSRVIELI